MLPQSPFVIVTGFLGFTAGLEAVRLTVIGQGGFAMRGSSITIVSS